MPENLRGDFFDSQCIFRGVATGWTGVDIPLLPEVVPEIDANPVSFYWGGEGCVTVVIQ